MKYECRFCGINGQRTPCTVDITTGSMFDKTYCPRNGDHYAKFVEVD